MTKRESQIEAELRDAVVAYGGLCIKLPASLYRGIPDRLVLLPKARVIFIELKRTKKDDPSIHQTRFREKLRTMGFFHIIMRGPEDLEEFKNAHLQKQ